MAELVHAEIHEIIHDPEDIAYLIDQQEKKRWKYGLMLIAVGVLTWVFGSEIINVVLKGNGFKKPFFIAWDTGSTFSIYLLPEAYGKIKSLFQRRNDEEEETPDSPAKTELAEPELIPLSHKEVVQLAFMLASIYFVYNSLAIGSLKFTSPSNTVILSTTTSIFTLIIGVFLGVEHFTANKLISILFSCSGIIFITIGSVKSNANVFSDDKYQPSNPALGNFMSCLGSLMYALYLLTMKVKCGDTRTTNERVLFGYIGVITLIGGIPILVMAHYLGIESFEFPSDLKTFFGVFGNGLLGIISDYACILAMLLTSPLVVSLALTTAIPLTMICDSIFFHIYSSSPLYYLGIFAILLAFLLINIGDANETIFNAIDNALDEAINHDEILSPILTPILSPLLNPQLVVKSPKIGVTVSGIIETLTPKLNEAKTPKPLINRQVSQFNLDDSVISYGSASNLDSIMDGNEEAENESDYKVSGGNNHKYFIRKE